MTTCKTFSFICFTIIIAMLSCSPANNTNSSFAKHELETIKKLELTSILAEFTLDTATVSGFMHDNFMAIYPNKIQTKQQEVLGIYNGIMKRKAEGETMDSLYLDDFKGQVYNNTAIVTFQTVTRGTRKGVPYQNQRMRWYDVWVKENGKWKLVSCQGTPLPK